MLAVVVAAGVYFAVSNYQKQENEKIIKLEKMRLEAQERERREQEKIKERERREQEKIKERERKELERKKQINILNAQLADLQQELSQLTVEAEKHESKIAALHKKIDGNITASLQNAEDIKSKLHKYEQIMRELRADISEFQHLDRNGLMDCFWECVPYDIFERPRKTLTGQMVDCMCSRCRSSRYKYHDLVFECSKHENQWNKSMFIKYKNLRSRWGHMKSDHQNKVARLRKYERLSIEQRKKLSTFRKPHRGSADKVVFATKEHKRLLRNIDDKKSEINRIQRKIKRLTNK